MGSKCKFCVNYHDGFDTNVCLYEIHGACDRFNGFMHFQLAGMVEPSSVAHYSYPAARDKRAMVMGPAELRQALRERSQGKGWRYKGWRYSNKEAERLIAEQYDLRSKTPAKSTPSEEDALASVPRYALDTTRREMFAIASGAYVKLDDVLATLRAQLARKEEMLKIAERCVEERDEARAHLAERTPEKVLGDIDRERDIQVVCKAVIENCKAYDDNGPDYCMHCYGKDWGKGLEHELNCPVLIARDLSTGLSALDGKEKP